MIEHVKNVKKEYPALPNRYTVHESFIKCWEAVESKADDFLDKLRKSGWLRKVFILLKLALFWGKEN